MFAGKAGSGQRPTALGTLIQASTYGMAIPIIGGMTRTTPLIIWAHDLRLGGSDKKIKKKKGPPTYIENVDFLLGQNPIFIVNQLWTNNNQRFPLNLVKYTVTPGPTDIITIPDANFYSIIGVTMNFNFTAVFNDFGSTGVPVTITGSCEVPLWNECGAGPDPIDNNGWRYWPNSFRWLPSFGASILYDPEIGITGIQPTGPDPIGSGIFTATGTWNLYYYQKSAILHHKTPLRELRLTFEPQLGDGPEYAPSSDPAQQIIYPQYAGLGSDSYDLGSAAVLPQLNVETQGAHSRYPTGDGDFADLIEDLVKSGLSQAAVDIASGGPSYSLNQHGVNLNAFPGMVQKKYYTNAAGSAIVPYDLPVTKGSVLLALMQNNNNASNAASDTLANTWNLLYDTGGINHSWARWAIANASGVDTVTFATSTTVFNIVATIAEIKGVDELDGPPVSAVSPGAGLPLTLAIQTTGTPTLLVCAVTGAGGVPPGFANDPTWVIDSNKQQIANGGLTLMHKIAPFPGIYTNTVYMGPGRGAMAIFAFRLTDPPNYPKALGNIIEPNSLELTRQQCRAGGLIGSWNLDSQKKAADWISDACICADCAPVMSGGQLKFIPYSEVSAVGGYGGYYVAPTASGPIAQLSEDDFISDGTNPPIIVKRKSVLDADNIIQIEHINRNTDYAPIITTQPDGLSISNVYGPRKASPVVLHMIQDVLVARKIAAIMARAIVYQRLTFEFTLPARFGLLEAMDLISIPDPFQLGSGKFVNIPVRLTSITENEHYDLSCEAEQFIYGVHAPDVALVPTTPAPYAPSSNADPGSINTPIIFEPVPRLSTASGLPELEFVISGASPNYGGSQAFVSTDGGNSYNPIPNGTTTGNGTTGVTVGDWPAHADPDTADDLTVDLTESLGTLASYLPLDRDEFTYPCYVEHGAGGIPYELMTYSLANLITGHQYTLPATGGGTNKLRRSVFGAPTPNQGVDHPSGSRFAFLGAPESPAPGVLRVPIDPKWIGVPLFFKFCAFNTLGGNAQGLPDATAYPYTIAGTSGTTDPNQFAYTTTPASPLSQASGTSIAMAQTTVNFPTNKVIYNARTFTIAAPSVPTTYWVTIQDTAMVGDTDALTNLTAFVDTTDVHVGVPGFTYIGSITVNPGMSPPATITPGGLPVSNTTILTFDGI